VHRLSTLRRIPLQVAFLAALIALVLQLVFAASAQPANMAMPMGDAAQVGTLPCASMCSGAVLHACVPASRVCAAIPASLTANPLILTLVVLFVTLVALMASPGLGQMLRQQHWLWPPDQRRALLQVFLI
jgi:hypothetical protein